MPSWDATVKDTYKTYVDDFTDVNANAVGDALNDIIPTTGTVGAARVGTDVTKFNFSGDQNLGSLLNNTLKRVRFKFKSAELSGALVSPASDAHMIRLISGSLLLAYCASNKNIQCIRNDTENVNILPAGWAITHPNGTTMIYSDGNNFNPFLLELSLNNILCFHTNLDKHGDNTILCTKSLNNGGAWASSVVVVTASTPAPMLPRAILLPSGDIICFFSQEGDISYTKSSDSGATWGAPLHPYNGGWYNLFVLKLDSSGVLQWHTFYGSSNSNDLDYGNSIALDHSGNIYVAGKSDSTWGSPLHPHSAGDPNVFILKLDNNGTYLWHTFYGISSTNYGVGLALDSDSNIYVTSTSAAWGIPLHDYSGNWDIFVLKLDSAGAYKWHTFYGSAGNDDFGYGIAVDGSGNVYVTGTSQGNWGSPLSAYSGNADFFLLKLNSSGTYQWHSFYGSGNDDWGWGVAVDTSGKVYVTGGSNATWGTPIHSFIGNESVFVLKLDDLAGSARVLSGGLPISSYSKLQDAYNAATDGDTIQAQTMVFTESLTFVANINVLLKGGYNYDFLLNPLMTTVKGVLTISGGTVTLENLIIN